MSVRYLSADQMIAAAGAAFACPDEDFSAMPSGDSRFSKLWSSLKRIQLKAVCVFGFLLF